MKTFVSPWGLFACPQTDADATCCDAQKWPIIGQDELRPGVPEGARRVRCASDAVRAGLMLHLWVRPDPDAALDAPPLRSPAEVPLPEGRSLRVYQREAVAFALARRGTLLAEEMGLGKTAEAIAVCNFHQGGTSRRFLVVCPATVKANWAAEIEAWDPFEPVVFVPDTPDDLPAEWPERTWVVCNDERLIAVGVTKKERAGGLWEALMRLPWDVLILDEAHRFKNPAAARTRRVLGLRQTRKAQGVDGLCSKAGKILALTGTPIPNRVRELWSLASTLAPEMFRREGDFLFRYCGAHKERVPVRGGKGLTDVWNFDGSSRLPELEAQLRSSCMVRRLKADVLTELPAKIRQVLPLDSPALRQAADAERDGWLKMSPAISQATLDAMLAQALRDSFAYEEALNHLDAELPKITGPGIAQERQALALAKVPLAVSHVNAQLEDPTQKVVVMAHHRAVVERLRDAFPYPDVCVYGGTPEVDRTVSIQRFQEDAKCRVFVGGMHAAGVGISLTAASLMVFVEPDYEHLVLLQCEDRIHRIGQTQPVRIQYLLASSSVESFILAAALRKMRVAGQAVDGSTPIAKRTVYPEASEAQKAECLRTIDSWVAEPGVLIDPSTRQILLSMRQKSKYRPLTNGEVWLCQKIAKKIGRLFKHV